MQQKDHFVYYKCNLGWESVYQTRPPLQHIREVGPRREFHSHIIHKLTPTQTQTPTTAVGSDGVVSALASDTTVLTSHTRNLISAEVSNRSKDILATLTISYMDAARHRPES